jgi:hypothetical protein
MLPEAQARSWQRQRASASDNPLPAPFRDWRQGYGVSATSSFQFSSGGLSIPYFFVVSKFVTM